MKTNLANLLKRLRSRGLARSVHRGRIKLQRAYVSKSSVEICHYWLDQEKLSAQDWTGIITTTRINTGTIATNNYCRRPLVSEQIL